MSPPRDPQDLELPDEIEGQPEEDDAEDALQADGQEGDEGADGDDADREEDEGEREESVDAPPRRQSRADRRVQTALTQAREARAQSQRLEEEMARLRAERQQAPQLSPEDEAAQERERLAIMTPEERTEYRLAKAERNTQRTLQNMQMQHQDALDKASYDAKATMDPRYKRYAPEVDKRLRDLRAQGQNVSRDALLKFILGEKLLERDAGATAKQKTAAGKRVANQAAPRMNGRTDVQRPSGRNLSLEKRLTGVQL